MHFVIFFLISVLYNRIEAATTTKINYLPNGQVGGYELIINNTVPTLKSGIPGRPTAFKQANKIVKTDSTFTQIDERVEGDNVFVNVKSLITKPAQKPRFPVSAILTVPSVRYNSNGVAENTKLTFAKIGPYAVLLVPEGNSREFWDPGNDNSVSSEIRNSVKAFIEVSDRPMSKQKEGFSYPPKSTAAGIPSVESRASDRRIVGGFSKTRLGPYEPAKYEYSNSKDGNNVEYQNQGFGETIQESGKLLENTGDLGIRSVQTSEGLLITLMNKSLIYAPTKKQNVLNKGSINGDSNTLFPYAPALPYNVNNAAGDTSQNTTPTVKSPYYSFLLSQQPPNVSWSIKENEGVQVQSSSPSNEGIGPAITRDQPKNAPIDNPYPPPSDEESFISKSSGYHQLASVSQQVPNLYNIP